MCWLSLDAIIKMSLELFNAVPAGAIEVLVDGEKKQPLFKRADLGRYLDIARIKDMFKDVKNISRQNLLIRGAVQNSSVKMITMHSLI